MKGRRGPQLIATLGALFMLQSCLRQESHTAVSPTTIARGDEWRAVQVKGNRREFLLHVPPSWMPTQSMPLVIILHGTHGDANAMLELTGMNAAADQRGFLVAYPNGTGFLKFLTWNVGGNCCGSALKGDADDVGFLRAIIDDLKGAVRIDASRVYVAGFSDGGMLAFRAACDAADRIAAIGVVAGRMPDVACAPKRPVPIIIFTGTKDPDVNTDFDRYVTATSFNYARGVTPTLDFWARVNGCEPRPVNATEGRHTRQTWRQCRGRSRIVSYAVTDAVHEWPRATADSSDGGHVHDLSATALMVAFFGNHALARPAAKASPAPVAPPRTDTLPK